MRPSVFHSRSEDIWVSTSDRLWTCMRSTFRIRTMERCIIASPASLPFVQTLVAIKSESSKCNCAASSPTTPSARPYIGEESTTRPPCLTRSESTSPSCGLFAGVRSTSNTLHVPSPITGNFSPDDGIVRVIMIDDWLAARAPIGKSNPAVVPPISFTASRLFIFD